MIPDNHIIEPCVLLPPDEMMLARLRAETGWDVTWAGTDEFGYRVAEWRDQNADWRRVGLKPATGLTSAQLDDAVLAAMRRA